MRELSILKPVAKLEEWKFLDPVIKEVERTLDRVLRRSPVEDVLHGVPIGHPLHPALVLVPAGTWISAAILDVVPGASRASRLLVGVGLLGAAPSILAGWTDWTRSHRQQQRVGIVHAAANEAAFVLYGLSWLDRRAGNEVRGRVLSYTGFALVAAGGYLGGHLGYRQAVGANHAEAAPHRIPAGWHSIGTLDSLPEEQPVQRDVEGEPLLVLRRGSRIDVLSDIGSHLGAPLHEGVFADDRGTGTITDPWHGSVYDVETGEVVRGPATTPQPRFDSRVNGELVEIRVPE